MLRYWFQIICDLTPTLMPGRAGGSSSLIFGSSEQESFTGQTLCYRVPYLVDRQNM